MKERLESLTRMVSVFIVGVALIAVYKTFDNLGIILSFVGRLFVILRPFVIGLGLAFLLYAPASRLEKLLQRVPTRFVRKLARVFSVLLVYLIVVVVLVMLLTFGLPALVRGAINFVNALPGYYDELMDFLHSLTGEGGILQGLDVTQTVDSLYSSYIEPQLTSEAVLSYFRGAMDFTTSLFGVFLAFIISIYMLLSRESLLRAGKLMLGIFLRPGQMGVLAHYTHRSCEILYNYFYSQALDALIVGILMTIGLILFGAPSAPLLGFMIGLLNMIPYFGAIIGGAVAIAITLLSGNVYGAIFVTIYIVAMQQVDANIIQPRIVADKVGIRPIYVLFAITLGGGLFGFWGVFLGVPAIAIVQMLLRDYLTHRRRTKKPPILPSRP